MKLAFYTGLFVSFPFLAIQIYIFLAPGLYKNEKIVLLPFLIITPILFILGGLTVYYWIFPMAWKFFLSFENLASQGNIAIELEARVSEYLSLVIHLIFAFGIAKIGVVTAQGLAKKRKYAIVGIVTLAAVITPPDIISQIGLAIILWVLYEFSIISCKIVAKGK
jgi:sec-independent protein translocase protein TatC